MKLKTAIILLPCFLLTSMAPLASAQSGGPLAITRVTFAGGGGTCAGGGFTLSGTIGQPDAGASSGGGFTLQGGFWTAPVEGGPRLRVTRLGSVLLVAWPETATGYVLQESASLSAPVWTNTPETPLAGNGEKVVLRSIGPGHHYFRLRKL